MGKNNKKYTLDEVREIVRVKGFELVSEDYVNNKTKLTLRDSEGYLYEMSLATLRDLKVKVMFGFKNSNPYLIYNINILFSNLGLNFKIIEINYNIENLIVVDNEGYYYIVIPNNLKKGKFPSRFHPNNPYTIQNIKLWLLINNYKYELLSEEYINTQQKLKLKDDKGYLYSTTLANFLAGYLPCIFHPDNEFSYFNMILWIKHHKPNYELLSKSYSGNKSKYLFKDNENYLYSVNWSEFQNRNPHKYYIENPYSVDNINNWCKINDFDFILLSKEYINNSTYMEWECLNCHQSFWQTLGNMQTYKTCLCCSTKSKGEKKTKDYLLQNNISFIKQFKFINCKYKRRIPFDFYLPEFNICIEYQGIQHYKPVDFAGKGSEWAEELFKLNQIKDQIKRDYCKNNNIKLIEIPYWEFDNIEEILQRELNIYIINDSNLTVVF